MLRSVKDN